MHDINSPPHASYITSPRRLASLNNNLQRPKFPNSFNKVPRASSVSELIWK